MGYSLLDGRASSEKILFIFIITPAHKGAVQPLVCPAPREFMAGWICLHRKILEWGWYSDINVCRLFTHLLLSANYEDKKWRNETVVPGQIITGLISLSQQTNLTPQQVRTALDKLKSTNEITIKTTTQYSLITICKWDDYQDINNQNNKRATNEQQTDNKRATTTKQVNKETKESIEVFALTSSPEKPEILKSKKGSRLPDDWELEQEDGDWAVEQGLTGEQVIIEADKFKDYWHSRADKGAIKKDWVAVWRNWIRSTIERKNNGIQTKKIG